MVHFLNHTIENLPIPETFCIPKLLLPFQRSFLDTIKDTKISGNKIFINAVILFISFYRWLGQR